MSTIYHISWDYAGYMLNAVVIADTPAMAMDELRLDRDRSSEVECTIIGLCTDGSTDPRVVVEESL